MVNSLVLSEIQQIIQSNDQADVILSTLVDFVGKTLECDRCFVYLRNPATGMGRVPFCWRRHDQIPTVFDADWKPEPVGLADDDPMFAAALRAEPSIYVEDVETADSQVLNRAFEQENFGHRALIHGHLRQDGQLWGVLQPCLFDQPRHWTDADRQFMTTMEQEMLPYAIAYVQTFS